jgi:hypothetical protein
MLAHLTLHLEDATERHIVSSYCFNLHARPDGLVDYSEHFAEGKIDNQLPVVRQIIERKGLPIREVPPAGIDPIAKVTAELLTGIYRALHHCDPTAETREQWGDLLKKVAQSLL